MRLRSDFEVNAFESGRQFSADPRNGNPDPRCQCSDWHANGGGDDDGSAVHEVLLKGDVRTFSSSPAEHLPSDGILLTTLGASLPTVCALANPYVRLGHSAGVWVAVP